MIVDTARQLARQAGVTRLADVTGFDRLGIPVMQAVRPQALSLSVSQGKGRSRWQAAISAMMEAMELSCAEQVQPDATRPPDRNEAELWNRHLPVPARLGPDSLGWVKATDLSSGRHCPMPLGLVSMDFTSEQPMQPISTGLAGQADYQRAVDTALCELRDRWGLQRFAAMGPLERRRAEIAPSSLPGREIGWAVARIARSGAHLRLWELAPEQPWPVFVAVLFDDDGGALTAPALGVCCRSSPSAAAFGAVIEAAQSRVTLLAGARDDISFDDYADGEGRLTELLLGSMTMRASERAASAASPLAAGRQRDTMLRLLEGEGAKAVTVATLGPAKWPLVFVKVLAPGLPDGERDGLW